MAKLAREEKNKKNVGQQRIIKGSKEEDLNWVFRCS